MTPISVFRLSISASIPEIFAISLKSFEIALSCACFGTVAPKIFGRRFPEFWDVDYSIEYFHHVAKFLSDRPTELGDLAAKKNASKI